MISQSLGTDTVDSRDEKAAYTTPVVLHHGVDGTTFVVSISISV